MKKRLFITIEGIEGVGKSTQISLLCSFLKSNNIKHISTREPGGACVCESIRKVLLKQDMAPLTELLLYEAARAEHFETVIAPALKDGLAVVCDRFIDSTTAYQGYGRGIELSLIDELNKIATKATMPDKTFILDMPVLNAFERLKKRGTKPDRFESLDHSFYEKVRSGYMELSRKYPERIVIINSDKSIEEVHNDIVRKLF